MRRHLFIVLAAAMLLSQPVQARADAGLTPGGSAIDGSTGYGVAEQAGRAQDCTAALADRRWPELGPRIEFEDPDVGPAGQFGRPRLCLVYFPREDVYTPVLTGIASVTQFRAAKPEAIARLEARGIDLCKVTKWLPWGSANTGYDLVDFYGVGRACPARVFAADPGAEAHLATAQDAYARAVAATAADLGWQPEPPLFIMVVTNADAAAEAYGRYRANFETQPEAEAIGRKGTARLVWGTGTNYVYGNLLQVNLVDPNYRTAGKIEVDVLGQYTRFAINQVVGKDLALSQGIVRDVPAWFDDGLQIRQEFRHTAGGASGGYLVEAARAVRAGAVPKLAELPTLEARADAWRRYGKYTVASWSYATVAYLTERHGEAAIGKLLVDNRNGSVEQFLGLVRALTGLDLDGLDAAVTGWLLERPRFQAASADGQVRVELQLFADGQHGHAVVDEVAAPCLFDLVGTVLVPEPGQPGLVGFSVALGPDGSFTSTRASARVGNAVSLAGQLSGGQLSGTYRVTNEVTGCDSGAVAFAPA